MLVAPDNNIRTALNWLLYSGLTLASKEPLPYADSDVIADLAVATNCGQIKTGSLAGRTGSPSTTS